MGRHLAATKRLKELHPDLKVVASGGFLLEKRIPVKKFSTGEPEFYLAPRHDTVRGKFVPIYPEEPFAYISRLKDAFLISRNGQAGILLEGNVDQYIDQ